MRGGDQLLRVRARSVLEAGLVRVSHADGVARSERSRSLRQVTLPFRASRCWHHELLVVVPPVYRKPETRKPVGVIAWWRLVVVTSRRGRVANARRCNVQRVAKRGRDENARIDTCGRGVPRDDASGGVAGVSSRFRELAGAATDVFCSVGAGRVVAR